MSKSDNDIVNLVVLAILIWAIVIYFIYNPIDRSENSLINNNIDWSVITK